MSLLDQLSAFWTELQRRSVVRAAILYAAAMWVVIQAATTVFPVLELPAWLIRATVITALAGFPVALILAWFFERKDRIRPRAALASVFVLILLGLGITAWSGRMRASTSLSAHTVAVLPFTVRGAPQYAYLGHGLVDLLSTKLNGAGAIRAAAPRAVIGVARQVGVDDERSALRVARGVGAGLFVLGDVIEAGGKLHVEATLYDAVLGTYALGSATVEGDVSNLFALVDDLAAQLLARANPGPGARMSRTAAMTTQSLPALKFYLEGEQLFRGGQLAAARDAFKNAIVTDTTFGLAYYRLSVVEEWLGAPTAAQSANAALLHSSRLSEHDRRLLEALVASRKGDGATAEKLYRAIVGSNPSDVDAWTQLAEVLWHYGPESGVPLSEGAAAFQRALEYEPNNVPALFHLMRFAVSENDRARSDSIFERLTHLAPEGDRLLEVRAMRAYRFGDAASRDSIKQAMTTSLDLSRWLTVWWVAAIVRDLDGAIELSQALTDPSRSPAMRISGYFVRANFHVAQGKLPEAQRDIAELRAIDRDGGILLNAYIALLPFLNTPQSQLRAVRNELAQWRPGVNEQLQEPIAFIHAKTDDLPEAREFLLGLATARTGDPAGATQQAKQLEARAATSHDEMFADWAHTIRAEAALALGDTTAALAHLQEAQLHVWYERTYASPLYSHAYTKWLRAKLLAATGKQLEAKRWFSSFQGSAFEIPFAVAAGTWK